VADRLQKTHASSIAGCSDDSSALIGVVAGEGTAGKVSPPLDARAIRVSPLVEVVTNW
jgi:hypothetical protein